MVFSANSQQGTPVHEKINLIMAEAFKRLGYEFRSISYSGRRALEMSNSGFTDGEAHRISGIDKTYTNLIQVPEIQQTLNVYAYSARGLTLPNGLNDLKNYKVAVFKGSIFTLGIADKYAKQIYEIQTGPNLLRFLLAERCDVVLSMSEAIDYLLLMDEFRDKGIQRLEPSIAAIPVYAYLHIRHKDLLVPLTNALREMKSDGTYAAIIEQVDRTFDNKAK